MEYVAIIEKAPDGSFSAYVPDLPGCTTCGDSAAEVRELIKEAVSAHIGLLKEFGDPVPPPSSESCLVQAA